MAGSDTEKDSEPKRRTNRRNTDESIPQEEEDPDEEVQAVREAKTAESQDNNEGVTSEIITGTRTREYAKIEDAMIERTRESFDSIMKNVPLKSDTIKVERRKEIRQAANVMRDTAMQLMGIIARMSQELTEKEREIKEARATNMQHTAGATTPEYDANYPSLPRNNQTSRNFAKATQLRPTQNKTFAIRIEPKEEGKTADQTRATLMKKIDPIKSNIAIASMRQTKTGGLIVECAGKSFAEKLKLSIATEAKAELKTVEVKKGLPRITINNVNSELEAESLMNIIIEQNQWLVTARGGEGKLRGEMRERFRFGGRGASKLASVVYEVSPGLRKDLINSQLRIGWYITQPTDHFSMMQCYNCFEFGHISKNCKGKQCCGYCSGEHTYKECNSEEQNCAVCIRANEGKRGKTVETNHQAKSERCPTMNRIRDGILRNIDYDGE